MIPNTLPNDFSLPNNASLCILRLSAIGDVCHAAATVQRIRTKRPDIRLTWIIGKLEYQLMKGLEGVEFLVFDKRAPRSEQQRFKAKLKQRNFDALCIMQVALRANLLSMSIRAPIRLGFDANHSKEGHSLFINKRIAPLHHPHVLDGFAAFADALGVGDVPQVSWNIPVSKQDEEFANEAMRNIGRYVAICPAASKKERCWSVEDYSAFAEHVSNAGFKPILCGGPARLDQELAIGIQKHSKIKILSLVGETSLKQLLCVLRGAFCVLAPDTGPAHMATAVDTPVIGLYAHSNPRRTGPYLSQQWVVNAYDSLIEQQQGKTWDKLSWGTRAKGDDLMSRVKLSDAIQSFEALSDSMGAKG